MIDANRVHGIYGHCQAVTLINTGESASTVDRNTLYGYDGVGISAAGPAIVQRNHVSGQVYLPQQTTHEEYEAGISVTGRARVQSNDIVRLYKGIRATGRAELYGNRVSDSGNGIEVYETYGPVRVSRNRASGNETGIYLVHAGRTLVDGNIVNDNGSGISVFGAPFVFGSTDTARGRRQLHPRQPGVSQPLQRLPGRDAAEGWSRRERLDAQHRRDQPSREHLPGAAVAATAQGRPARPRPHSTQRPGACSAASIP